MEDSKLKVFQNIFDNFHILERKKPAPAYAMEVSQPSLIMTQCLSSNKQLVQCKFRFIYEGPVDSFQEPDLNRLKLFSNIKSKDNLFIYLKLF